MVKKDNVCIKRDYFSGVMIVQMIVCICIIALLLMSARSNGKFANAMKTSYAKFMTGDFTVDDFADAFKSVKEYTATFSSEMSDVSEEYSESKIESETETVKIGGGADLEFTSLDALEGICFDKYNANISFAFPLKEYEITSLFGYRISPVSGNAGIHTGLDMATDYGMPIYASADGKVVDASYDNSYGYYVKLEHSDGYVTIYAHCSELSARTGDNVKQGEKIAEVGSTGDSTGNHLHFEIRKDNIRIDPYYALFENEN